MLQRFNPGYGLSSLLKFPFPQLQAFDGKVQPNSSVLRIFKSDSEKLKNEVPQARLHAVQQGGHFFKYHNDHTEVIVGVKGNKFYEAGAKVARAIKANSGDARVVIQESEVNELGKFVSGLVQANYKYKQPGVEASKKEQEDEEKGRFQRIYEIYVPQPKDVELDYKLAYYKCYARELINQRVRPTTFYLEEARELFKNNPQVTIEALEGEDLLREGLNLHHAVGRGAVHPPVMVNITYRGNPDDPKMYALVGKGITFDTGGLHLKSYGNMETMYMDKSGACAVLAATRGAVEMNLKVNFTATLGMAENAIDAKAYKPSEILQSHRGLTVEINNTDAEGRLVLADCISWTQKRHNPAEMIEISTLTGACQAALGENTGGLFATEDGIANRLFALAKEVEEPLWRLPVTDEHHELMKGKFADLCNVGSGKLAGASKAAAFLFSFVDKKMPFVHLDIAGPSDAKSDKNMNSFGATGFGTQILLKYLLSL